MVLPKIRDSFEKINPTGLYRWDEPLQKHCTFQVGGPADLLFWPATVDDLTAARLWAERQKMPVTVIGSGSNIVPADKGLPGLVIATTALVGLTVSGTSLTAAAGCLISDVSAAAADFGLAGLDFIYAMPGTVGGAVWMNARCYDSEIAAVLESVTYLDQDLTVQIYRANPTDFAYKQSPFQRQPWIVLGATFKLQTGTVPALWQTMKAHQADRTAKGHFRAPCAGSIFKNNHSFGQSSGQLIDSLGLRGQRIGGACVSPDHANIIINDAGATAADIAELTRLIQNNVKTALGFSLEPEVLFIGEW